MENNNNIDYELLEREYIRVSALTSLRIVANILGDQTGMLDEQKDARIRNALKTVWSVIRNLENEDPTNEDKTPEGNDEQQ